MVDVLLECVACRFRQLAPLEREQYRPVMTRAVIRRDCPRCGGPTEWKFGYAEADQEDVIPRHPDGRAGTYTPAEGAERRRAKRLTVKRPTRIRLPGSRQEVPRTENLSKTGVCFFASLVMEPQDRILLTVGYTAGGDEEEMPARVVWRRELEGGSQALYGVGLDDPGRGEV